MSKWKLQAPKDGDPSSKTVNGRKFNWCAKCGNWTTTHDTSTHTGGGSAPPAAPAAETNLAAWDPSAWVTIAESTVNVSQPSALLIASYIYMVLTMSYLLSLLLPCLFDWSAFCTFVIHHWNLYKHLLFSGLAPLCWFLAGYAARVISSSSVLFNPITDIYAPPRQWRRQSKVKRTNAKPSAWKCNLHRSYPHRL
jgi:hypothetical protein